MLALAIAILVGFVAAVVLGIGYWGLLVLLKPVLDRARMAYHRELVDSKSPGQAFELPAQPVVLETVHRIAELQLELVDSFRVADALQMNIEQSSSLARTLLSEEPEMLFVGKPLSSEALLLINNPGLSVVFPQGSGAGLTIALPDYLGIVGQMSILGEVGKMLAWGGA